jgi:hypothetical protein
VQQFILSASREYPLTIIVSLYNQIITPFTSTLGDEKTDLLPAIYAILLSDVYLTPLLRLIDVAGNFKKHVLAPRAKTQEEMNLNFQGTFYNLGERYTVSHLCLDMIILHALFSSPYLPLLPGLHKGSFRLFLLFCVVSFEFFLRGCHSLFSILR